MNVCVPGRGNSKFIALRWGCLGNKKEASACRSGEQSRRSRGRRRRGWPHRLAGHHRRMGFCSWLSPKVCLRYVPGRLASKSPALPESLLIYSVSFCRHCPFLAIFTTISSSVCNCEPCPVQNLARRGGGPTTLRTEC